MTWRSRSRDAAEADYVRVGSLARVLWPREILSRTREMRDFPHPQALQGLRLSEETQEEMGATYQAPTPEMSLQERHNSVDRETTSTSGSAHNCSRNEANASCRGQHLPEALPTEVVTAGSLGDWLSPSGTSASHRVAAAAGNRGKVRLTRPGLLQRQKALGETLLGVAESMLEGVDEGDLGLTSMGLPGALKETSLGGREQEALFKVRRTVAAQEVAADGDRSAPAGYGVPSGREACETRRANTDPLLQRTPRSIQGGIAKTQSCQSPESRLNAGLGAALANTVSEQVTGCELRSWENKESGKVASGNEASGHEASGNEAEALRSGHVQRAEASHRSSSPWRGRDLEFELGEPFGSSLSDSEADMGSAKKAAPLSEEHVQNLLALGFDVVPTISTCLLSRHRPRRLEAARSLRHAGREGSPRVRAALGAAGALRSLIRVLREKGDEELRLEALEGLVNLSCECPENQAAMPQASLDAGSLILQAMGPQSPMPVREAAAELAFSLSVLPTNRPWLFSAGFVPALVAALQGSSATKRLAILALINIAHIKNSRAFIVSCGAVPPLLQLAADMRSTEEEASSTAEKALVVLKMLTTTLQGCRAVASCREWKDILLLASGCGESGGHLASQILLEVSNRCSYFRDVCR